MSRRAQENLVCLALLAVFVGVVWLAGDFGPRARMIPLPLAIAGIVLTVLQLLWQNLGSTEGLRMDLVRVGETPALDEAPPATTPPPHRRAELRAYGIVALLIALVFTIGIIPAVFVFTAAYFVASRQYSWLLGLAWTSLFTIAVYLLFIAALQIEPYHGLLAPIVERFR